MQEFGLACFEKRDGDAAPVERRVIGQPLTHAGIFVCCVGALSRRRRREQRELRVRSVPWRARDGSDFEVAKYLGVTFGRPITIPSASRERGDLVGINS